MFADTLLAWYDQNYRRLPWRAPPGAPPSGPYRVWLSEIMLQQTTVAAVVPYFERFVGRWPTVDALAGAERDQVLAAWAGLGYYARARNLHRCAQMVAGGLGGCFPDTEDALKKLPGVGPYTAAAIAAIAFGKPAVVVDGNVERVVARLFAIQDPLPGSKPKLRALAAQLTPPRRAGDYAQAMMDLGATVCRPRAPACAACPLDAVCAARRRGLAGTLPRRAPRPDKPTRRGRAFWVRRADGRVLLRRRPPDGLLGGMLEVPSSPWTEDLVPESVDDHAPARCRWRPVAGTVRHTFTHFRLELDVVAGTVGALDAGPGSVWADPDEFDRLALPTVMKKVARLALEAEGA
jgi:A/G-specific adenine glycosylase